MVKWSRYWSGVAQRVGRGIALLFHNHGTRRGWVVSSTPQPHFTPGKDPVPILQEAGWAPGPVWTGRKSRPHRDSIPDCPARSQSLYWLSYPAHDTPITLKYNAVTRTQGQQTVWCPWLSILGTQNLNQAKNSFIFVRHFWIQSTIGTAHAQNLDMNMYVPSKTSTSSYKMIAKIVWSKRKLKELDNFADSPQIAYQAPFNGSRFITLYR